MRVTEIGHAIMLQGVGKARQIASQDNFFVDRIIGEATGIPEKQAQYTVGGPTSMVYNASAEARSPGNLETCKASRVRNGFLYFRGERSIHPLIGVQG